MLKTDRIRRKKRIRARVTGTAERPRLSVFRSNKAIYVQAIDDMKGVTLAQASGKDAKAVGEDIAKKLTKEKKTAAVFDRSGYRYHGRVKILADAARSGGLTF